MLLSKLPLTDSVLARFWNCLLRIDAFFNCSAPWKVEMLLYTIDDELFSEAVWSSPVKANCGPTLDFWNCLTDSDFVSSMAFLKVFIRLFVGILLFCVELKFIAYSSFVVIILLFPFVKLDYTLFRYLSYFVFSVFPPGIWNSLKNSLSFLLLNADAARPLFSGLYRMDNLLCKSFIFCAVFGFMNLFRSIISGLLMMNLLKLLFAFKFSQTSLTS